MKNITACRLYFLTLLSICFLSLLNYFMTHKRDGFARTNSLSLDLQKFHCYQEIHDNDQCKNILQGSIIQNDDSFVQRCNDIKTKMEKCRELIKSKDDDILDHCWNKMFTLYNCLQLNKDKRYMKDSEAEGEEDAKVTFNS